MHIYRTMNACLSVVIFAAYTKHVSRIVGCGLCYRNSFCLPKYEDKVCVVCILYVRACDCIVIPFNFPALGCL